MNDDIGSVLVQEDLDSVVVLQVELCMMRFFISNSSELLEIWYPRTLTRSLLAREYAVPLTAGTADQSRPTKRAASLPTFVTGFLECFEDRSSEQTCSVIPSERLLLQISQRKAAYQTLRSLAF